MLTPENPARLQALRQKQLANTITKDELKEGLAILRQDRVAAQASSTASKTKAAAERVVVDPTAVLANLKAIGQKLASGPAA